MASNTKPTETPSAQLARKRRDAARRKREERTRKKIEGAVDPRIVDRVIVRSLRDLVLREDLGADLRDERPIAKTFEVSELVTRAARGLLDQGFDGRAVGAAIISRLARPEYERTNVGPGAINRGCDDSGSA
jgi:hypothetical protein